MKLLSYAFFSSLLPVATDAMEILLVLMLRVFKHPVMSCSVKKHLFDFRYPLLSTESGTELGKLVVMGSLLKAVA
jgi:hypothetical protein